MSKLLLAAIAQVLFVKIVFSQCADTALNQEVKGSAILNEIQTPGVYSEQASESSMSKNPPTYGGAFAVQSSSPIKPTGISITAEGLVIDGNLVVSGSLPFSGTVELDGSLPATGQSSVKYSCGYESNVGIVTDSSSPVKAAGNSLYNGIPSGVPQGIPNGIARGVPQEIPQKNINGIPRGVSQGITQGMPNGLFNSNRYANAAAGNSYRRS